MAVNTHNIRSPEVTVSTSYSMFVISEFFFTTKIAPLKICTDIPKLKTKVPVAFSRDYKKTEDKPSRTYCNLATHHSGSIIQNTSAAITH